MFDAHPALGAGADGYETARLRYRTAPLESNTRTASSCRRSPTSASSASRWRSRCCCWMAAAGRATHPFNRRWTSWRAWLALRAEPAPALAEARVASVDDPELAHYTPERIGLLSMLCLVVVFGVHSLVDWTWYVPGDACVALLCAGWLAGRGPLNAWTGDRPGARERSAATGGSCGAPAPGEPRCPRGCGCRDRCASSARCAWAPPGGGRRRAARGLVAVAAAALGRRLASRRSALLATQPARPRWRRTDGRLARSAVGASAVHARDDPAGRRPAGARAGDAAAGGAPAALQPADVAGARRATTSTREPAGRPATSCRRRST